MDNNFSPTHTNNDNNDALFDPSRFSSSSSTGNQDNSIPELTFNPPSGNDDFDPSFFGSYGNTTPSAPPTFAQDTSGSEGLIMPDFGDDELSPPPVLPGFNDDSLPSGTPDFSTPDYSAPQEPFTLPEEDLVIPSVPAPPQDAKRERAKSMSYEDTVKIQNARHAEKDAKRINEPIRKDARPNFTPREREFNGIASGTAHVSGGLPELRDDQMYVALTPKELRRLKSRKFRGLGVFFTLCMAIVAAFCIWTYANSFADPIVGRWKGNISSVALGMETLSQLEQDSISSTWEFSSSGTLYVNLMLNDTPVSLSGMYVKKTDKDGEQYLAMTLKNPMDNQDYSFNMYYTITGSILQFNDMDGVGAEIDLTKE